MSHEQVWQLCVGIWLFLNTIALGVAVAGLFCDPGNPYSKYSNDRIWNPLQGFMFGMLVTDVLLIPIVLLITSVMLILKSFN